MLPRFFLRNHLDATGAERSQLERIRQTLGEQVEGLSAENAKLQACNADIQRQRDQLEDEKDDVGKDKERQYKENERWLANSTYNMTELIEITTTKPTT